MECSSPEFKKLEAARFPKMQNTLLSKILRRCLSLSYILSDKDLCCENFVFSEKNQPAVSYNDCWFHVPSVIPEASNVVF